MLQAVPLVLVFQVDQLVQPGTFGILDVGLGTGQPDGQVDPVVLDDHFGQVAQVDRGVLEGQVVQRGLKFIIYPLKNKLN